MLTQAQRAQLAASIASSAAYTESERLTTVAAIERAMTARAYGSCKLPLRGSEVERLLPEIASLMCGTPTTPRLCTTVKRFIWGVRTLLGSHREYSMEQSTAAQQRWTLKHEITHLAPEEARHLTQDQAERLEEIAPGICLASVQMVLAATDPVDAPLMSFREVDSIEWLIQRIAMFMFLRRLEKWSMRSCTLKRRAYSWSFNGVDYEIYEVPQQRMWHIRVKPLVTYQQLVDAAPLDFSKKGNSPPLFTPEQRLAMQKILMNTTAHIAERDIPDLEPEQLRHKISRMRAVTALHLCMANAQREVRSCPRGDHALAEKTSQPIVHAVDIRDPAALFHGLADVMFNGAIRGWSLDSGVYSWTTPDRIAYSFYESIGVWYIRYDLPKPVTRTPPQVVSPDIVRDIAASFYARLRLLEDSR